jgi:cyclopentanol dehydrogenase
VRELEKGNRLAGKVALITGGAGGQGTEEAKLFVNQGAKVVLADISEEAVRKIATELQEMGGEVLPIVQDVSSEEDWKRLINQTYEHFGALNILVNNAGILSRGGIDDTDLETWEKIQAVNSRSVFLGIKHAVPLLRKAGGGAIINISSIYGLVGSGGSAAYHASKGAIRLLTKTAALEYAKDHIRVNSIHPGVIVTPMVHTNNPEAIRVLQQKTPWPRLGKPEDIAYGVLYLASDESTFVTGTELVIDGGYTAQ